MNNYSNYFIVSLDLEVEGEVLCGQYKVKEEKYERLFVL